MANGADTASCSTVFAGAGPSSRALRGDERIGISDTIIPRKARGAYLPKNYRVTAFTASNRSRAASFQVKEAACRRPSAIKISDYKSIVDAVTGLFCNQGISCGEKLFGNPVHTRWCCPKNLPLNAIVWRFQE